MATLEQRKYTRYNVQGTVILKPEDGTSRTIKADLNDISFVGIGIWVQEKIAEGIEVKFELIDALRQRPTIGKGKIKHIQEIKKCDSNVFRVGVEFIDVDKKAIQHIIRRIQTDIQAEIRKKRHFQRHPSTSGQFWP